MVKAGFKTTEFWVTVLVDIASLASAIAGVLPAKYAAVASAIATAAYAVSRGITKNGAPSSNVPGAPTK